MQIIELKIAKEIATQTAEDDGNDYAPASGKHLYINCFHGSAAFTQNSVVKLVWKYDHATESEEILWAVKGEGCMPFIAEIPATDTDGIRKLAVVCDNGETGPLVMAGYAKIKEV